MHGRNGSGEPRGESAAAGHSTRFDEAIGSPHLTVSPWRAPRRRRRGWAGAVQREHGADGAAPSKEKLKELRNSAPRPSAERLEAFEAQNVGEGFAARRQIHAAFLDPDLRGAA